MLDNRPALSVERYSGHRKAEWDSFVRAAKNGTFLFCRDYMDYHSDRFVDHSLMVYSGGQLVGLLPANLAGDGTLISHQGLTYGGLVVERATTLTVVLECFRECLSWLHAQQIVRLVYKRIPSFYCTFPDDDVAYALFILGAELRRRDCAMVVNLADRLAIRKGRKSEISKAKRFGVQVMRDTTFAPFWEKVLTPRLADRYGVRPVHCLEEITLLGSRFPENVKQFSAYYEGEIVAGATIYETTFVAHAQYSSVSEKGRKIGALDYLFAWLMDEVYQNKRHFDFGICNENEGRSLNHGLLDWKEAFGGRCYVHDSHDVRTESYTRLALV